MKKLRGNQLFGQPVRGAFVVCIDDHCNDGILFEMHTNYMNQVNKRHENRLLQTSKFNGESFAKHMEFNLISTKFCEKYFQSLAIMFAEKRREVVMLTDAIRVDAFLDEKVAGALLLPIHEQ